MMKKLSVLVTILALMTLALSGCSNLFVEPRQGPDQGSAPSGIPEGFGAIRVSFFQGTARTLVPELILESVRLEYLFVKDGEAEEAKTPEGGRFVLTPGTYTLRVKAYADAEKTQLAAEGTSASFVIAAGLEAAPVDLALRPIGSEGDGSLDFELRYPTNTTLEILSLTRIAGEEEPIDLNDPAITPSGSDPLTLAGTKTGIPAGYYLLRVALRDDSGLSTGKIEVAHIYRNLTAKTDSEGYIFTQDSFKLCQVTTIADAGPGSLRQALADLHALTAPAPVLRIMLPPGSVIALESALPAVTRSMTIEGNGVTLTRASSWTDSSDTSQLLYISGNGVTIRRVHFKNGRATRGGAIHSSGTPTLESCIFSGNSAGINGGALYSGGSLIVRGCTFYGNTSGQRGGALSVSSSAILTGNLFYENAGRSNVVGNLGAGNSSYNVVDIPFGTGVDENGWAGGTGDVYSSTPFLLSGTFKVLQGSAAAGRLPDTLPEGYPRVDFYGQPISGGGAAGAAQALTPSGYSYLGLSVNNTLAGSVSADPVPDEDGFVPNGSVILTASTSGPSSAFVCWLQDGVQASKDRSYTLAINGHTRVQAVFSRTVTVNDFTDGPGSASQITLHYALANTEDGDIITFSEVTPGVTEIALEGALPEVTKSITIEGNGITLTRAASWTVSSDSSQMLFITNYNAEVLIRRVRFKDGMATNNGAAIWNNGTLTLESCVFSGARVDSYGGAIYSLGGLTIRGCTFYDNAANQIGAVNVSRSMPVTLTGNLFYRNTARYYPVINPASIVASYNVVDTAFGTGTDRCGWTAGTGDVYTTDLLLSPRTFKVLSGSAAAGRLPAELPGDYPTVDFYGQAISGGGAAGAVQAVTPNGYSYLVLSVNNSLVGEVSASPAPDEDGLVPNGSITLTATETGSTSGFVRWLQDGAPVSTARSYNLNISGHTFIQGEFSRTVTVNDWSDAAGSASQVTLRYALANAGEGDVITLSGAAPGTEIALESALQFSESIRLIIEGGGVTLTRASTTTNSTLLSITNESAELTIRRLHFKDGLVHGYAAAIRNNGILTLESCVFSGNQGLNTASNSVGGCVYSNNTMTIRGCTFYGNSVGKNSYAGAVFFDGSSNDVAFTGSTGKTLTMTGNLFYNNTATFYPVMCNRDFKSYGIIVASYNVVDVAFGTSSNQCGWTAGTGDATFAALSITGDPIDTTTFVPVSGLQSVLPTAPADFPTTDFYGATRTFPGAPGAVAVTPSP
jgi:hypothetical protein